MCGRLWHSQAPIPRGARSRLFSSRQHAAGVNAGGRDALRGLWGWSARNPSRWLPPRLLLTGRIADVGRLAKRPARKGASRLLSSLFEALARRTQAPTSRHLCHRSTSSLGPPRCHSSAARRGPRLPGVHCSTFCDAPNRWSQFFLHLTKPAELGLRITPQGVKLLLGRPPGLVLSTSDAT